MTVQTSPITQLPGGPVDAPVAAAAKLRGVTPTQILLAWVKAKGAVIVTSVASQRYHHTPITHQEHPTSQNEFQEKAP